MISSARRTQLQNAKGFVMLMWHMHQPPMVIPGSQTQLQPYARFHAMRGYRDMPLWSSRHGVRTIINLTPSLLQQLELYSLGGSDLYLDHARLDPKYATPGEKAFIINNFFQANEELSVKPYPRYLELSEKKARGESFTDQEIIDLQVWHNLSMFGYGLKNDGSPVNSRINALIRKGRSFSQADKYEIIEIQFKIIKEVLTNYRQLQDEGLVSVTLSPFSHPIMPLLCDQEIARKDWPNGELPTFRHPEDVKLQLHMAALNYLRLFGRDPRGLWPSEGAVSAEIFPLIADAIPSIDYLFTDIAIRLNSQPAISETNWGLKFSPHRYGKHQMFFRDRGLSDTIGFHRPERREKTIYEMAHDIYMIIEHAAGLGAGRKPVVPLVIDGENLKPPRANDAFDFLDDLYRLLTCDPKVVTILPEEYLEISPPSPELTSLYPGSWISGDFKTWTGVGPTYARVHQAEQYLEGLYQAFTTRYSAGERLDADNMLINFSFHRNLFSAYQGLSQAARVRFLMIQAESSCFRWWLAGQQGELADLGQFDKQYRSLIAQAYVEMGLPLPNRIETSFYSDRSWGRFVDGVMVNFRGIVNAPPETFLG